MEFNYEEVNELVKNFVFVQTMIDISGKDYLAIMIDADRMDTVGPQYGVYKNENNEWITYFINERDFINWQKTFKTQDEALNDLANSFLPFPEGLLEYHSEIVEAYKVSTMDIEDMIRYYNNRNIVAKKYTPSILDFCNLDKKISCLEEYKKTRESQHQRTR